jgi:predicted heme/steroid binding protein
MTLEELKKYNGKDEKKICIAIKGEIFDVSRGASFYGPGGPYDVFAGREASRAFAKFSFKGLKNTYAYFNTIFTLNFSCIIKKILNPNLVQTKTF